MTCIIATRTAVYADSQATSEICCTVPKATLVTFQPRRGPKEEYLVGQCGELHVSQLMVNLVQEFGLHNLWKLYLDPGKTPDIFEEDDCNACLLVVKRDGTIWEIQNKLIPLEIKNDHYCTGSGGIWASAALDFGETLESAVEYACKRDVYSALPVVKIEFPKDEARKNRLR